MIEATVLAPGYALRTGQIVLVPEGAIAAIDIDGKIPVLTTDGVGLWATWTELRLHIDQNLNHGANYDKPRN